MKEIWDKVKFYAGAWVVALVIGFFLGKSYGYQTLIADCKVLGMTRFGDVPMGCRIGAKSE